MNQVIMDLYYWLSMTNHQLEMQSSVLMRDSIYMMLSLHHSQSNLLTFSNNQETKQSISLFMEQYKAKGSSVYLILVNYILDNVRNQMIQILVIVIMKCGNLKTVDLDNVSWVERYHIFVRSSNLNVSMEWSMNLNNSVKYVNVRNRTGNVILVSVDQAMDHVNQMVGT